MGTFHGLLIHKPFSVHHSGTYLPSNNGGAKLSDERRIFAQTKISVNNFNFIVLAKCFYFL